MTILGKKQMSEEDIKLNFITPVIQRGWKGHITMETRITDGRINIRGNIVARSKPKFADYLLYLNDGKPIAVVEAKDNNHSVSHGLQQAMTYAQMMDLPFAYSSNGDAFYEHDYLYCCSSVICILMYFCSQNIGYKPDILTANRPLTVTLFRPALEPGLLCVLAGFPSAFFVVSRNF